MTNKYYDVSIAKKHPIETKRIGKTIKYTFSQEELKAKLLPALHKRSDIEILLRSKKPLVLSVRGFSKKDLKSFDWGKKFEAYKATSNNPITETTLSEEAKSKLKEQGVTTIAELTSFMPLTKCVRESGMSKEVISEVNLFLEKWHQGIGDLIRKDPLFLNS